MEFEDSASFCANCGAAKPHDSSAILPTVDPVPTSEKEAGGVGWFWVLAAILFIGAMVMAGTTGGQLTDSATTVTSDASSSASPSSDWVAKTIWELAPGDYVVISDEWAVSGSQPNRCDFADNNLCYDVSVITTEPCREAVIEATLSTSSGETTEISEPFYLSVNANDSSSTGNVELAWTSPKWEEISIDSAKCRNYASGY